MRTSGRPALLALASVIIFFAADARAESSARVEIDCQKAIVQAEITYCAQEDLKKTDYVLNRVYQRRLRQLDGPAQVRLRSMQRQWLKQRDTKCMDAVGRPEDSGSIWPTLYAGCLEDETLDQIAKVFAFN